MAVKIAEDRHCRFRAGQSVRIIDMPADAGRSFGLFDHSGEQGPGILAEAIQHATATAYGTAGPSFVRELISRHPSELNRLVSRLVDEFVADNLPTGADGQVRRVTARFGLVAAAGELARTWGIVPWAEGEAKAAAALLFPIGLGRVVDWALPR